MNPHRSQPAPGEPPSGEALAWQSRDGLVLRGRMWPPGETSSAVIGLVHGLGEHCGRYAVLVDCLNRAGCTMAAFDLRGHGLSDGTRGHARSYRALMHDISDFLEVVSGRTSGQAVFLYGHGLGGNLVINFLLRHQRAINGVVASAPVLRPSRTIPLWKRALVRFLRYAYPTATLPSGLELPALSRDPAVVAAYRADPLVHNRVSARLAVDVLEAGEWALERAADFPRDLLLMHGTADRIASPEASRRWCIRAGSGCELQLWEGFRHELLHEPGREAVLARVAQWIGRRTAAHHGADR
ncbi:MAG: lysophospholipase [Verrucomicrobiales bacterium]|nr:lysophospholipase [Verrucomicrobiales bacterium]